MACVCGSQMKYPLRRQIPAWLVHVSNGVLLLLFLTDINEVAGENEYSLPRTTSLICNGKNPCVQPAPGSFVTSTELGLHEADDISATPQIGTGSDPNDACPTAALPEFGSHSHSVGTQASWR
jgi:hypothetical protein